MSKELGKTQQSMLEALQKHGVWYSGCGWIWNSINGTQRILDSLVRRGEVTVNDGYYRIANVDSLALRVQELGAEYNATMKAWQDASHTVFSIKQDDFRSGADRTDYGSEINFNGDILWAATKLEHMLDVKKNHLHKQLVNAQVKLDALRLERIREEQA